MSEPTPSLLIIEDETHMRRFLRAALVGNGYQVFEAETGADGLAQAGSRNPDLILLDLGLPDQDGLTVTESLRRWAKMPIIVLSARGKEEDKIKALDAGADDYLTKPFGIDELLARITATLRRSRPAPTTDATPLVLDVLDLHIDLGAELVTKGGQPVRLTPTEFALLREFVQHPGKLLTHAVLLRRVWGPGYATETEYTRVYVRRLRSKLESQDGPALIVTEPRQGYRFVLPSFTTR